MINSKKGSELTLNVIIIAVLAVLVLVVLVLIFTGKIGMFASATGCTESGGKCVEKSTCKLPNVYKIDSECTPKNLPDGVEITTVCCYNTTG